MPQQPLPSNPDIDELKSFAKLLRDLVRAGDPESIALVREHHPRAIDVDAFKLADAQLTVARHHGLESWPKLKQRVELVNRLARSPHVQEVGTDDADPADELLRLGCLTYGADDRTRPDQARDLLDAQPDLAAQSIFTIAAAGDADAAARLLSDSPALVDAHGGPFDWPPLLYAAYSRIPRVDTLPVAEVLLHAGADPNSGYLWEGLIPPFTALTGVLGGGEQAQSAHARSLEFAELLLDHGADPNDGQAVYNRSTGGGAVDDTAWLELLFDHGLGRGGGGPWYRLLSPSLGEPAELVGELLQHAAEKGLVQRTRSLLAHGADPNGTGMHPTHRGRTAYQGAVLFGNAAVVDLLEAAGADRASVSWTARLAGRLLSETGPERAADPDPAEVGALIAERPGLVADAVRLGRRNSIARLVELGFDVNHRDRTTALHDAASSGDEDAVRLLLDLGADPSITDTSFDAEPAGWAAHNGHDDLAEFLGSRSPTPPSG